MVSMVASAPLPAVDWKSVASGRVMPRSSRAFDDGVGERVLGLRFKRGGGAEQGGDRRGAGVSNGLNPAPSVPYRLARACRR